MAGFNMIIIQGNLTRDPSLTYIPNSQTPVVDFGMAYNKQWTGSDGQKREKVTFVDCVAFGKRAETINQYVRKGHLFLVEGELEQDRWEDEAGNSRSKHKINVSGFAFQPNKDIAPAATPAPTPAGAPAPQGGASYPPPQSYPPQSYPPPGDVYDGPPPGDSIPF